MRNAVGGMVAAIWLVASILLWAGVVQVVPPPSASHAIGLSLSQSVLLAYHLSDVLGVLTGAYLRSELAGFLAGAWLLVEGLARRMRLASALGGAAVILEIALGLFTLLRIRLSLPLGPNASGLLTGASIAGQLAMEMIPAALLVVLALGAIVIVGRFALGGAATARSRRALQPAAAGPIPSQTGTPGVAHVPAAPAPGAGAARNEDRTGDSEPRGQAKP